MQFKVTARPSVLRATKGLDDIGDTGSLVQPAHALTVLRKLERMPDATTILIIQVATDLMADDRADNRAEDDGHRTALTDLRTDCAAHDAAQYGANRVAITSTVDDSVVMVPLAAGLAEVVRIMLLAPAVRGRMRRRVRKRRQRKTKDCCKPCCTP